MSPTLSPTAIADAALRLVATGGMSTVTYRAVANEAGCSLGAVQRAFPTRGDLVGAMIARMRESARAERSLGEPGRPTLADWLIDLTLDVLPLDDESRARALQADGIGSLALHDPELSAGIRREDERMRGSIAMLVGRAIAEGELPASVSPELVALAWHALASGLTDHVLREGGDQAQLRAVIAAAIPRILELGAPLNAPATTA